MLIRINPIGRQRWNETLDGKTAEVRRLSQRRWEFSPGHSLTVEEEQTIRTVVRMCSRF